MFLDIAFGLIAALGVSTALQIPLTWDLMILGPLFALSPDMDFLIHLGRGGSSKNDDRHREILHLPLIFIPIGMLGIAFLMNPVWALLFGICALGHFIHDSIGIGWGVQWLFPVTSDHYSFFYIYQPQHKEPHPKKVVYRWKNAEIEKLAELYGDPDWIRNIYLQFHPYALFEYAALIASVIEVFVYRHYLIIV